MALDFGRWGKKKTFCAMGATALLLQAGCLGGGGDDFVGGNNRAVLEGDEVFGDRGSYRPVDVTFDAASTLTTMTILGGALSRNSDDSSYIRSIIEVRNDGSSGRCFVRAEISFMDRQGEQIYDDDLTYVKGSVSESGLSYTATCLAVGEVGYFITIDDAEDADVFHDIDEVQLKIEDSRSAGPDAPASVIPERYRVDSGDIVVTVKNEGPEEIEFGIGTLAIFFDQNDELMTWEYLSAVDGRLVGEGESADMESFWLTLPAPSSKIDVLVDFDEPYVDDD